MQPADVSRLPDYIPPKKPYSFLAMLNDILSFAAATLLDGGRLAFWMPTSNEEAEEIQPPTHPCLQIVAVCSQDFNKCESFSPPSLPPRMISSCFMWVEG